MATGRTKRIMERERNPRWARPARRIAHDECIVCDSCKRACPPQFGAIFNHGLNVVIVAELCSGCDACVSVCPVDCIYEASEPFLAPSDLWDLIETSSDPWVNAEEPDLVAVAER